jgi:hypothetical protein
VFAVSPGTYLLIAYMTLLQGVRRPPPNSFVAAVYNPGLIILTVAALVLGLAFERSRLRSDRLAAARAASPSAVAGRYVAAAAVQTAVYEAVAIWGLIYFIFGGTFANMVKFCAVSWVLLGVLLVKLFGYIAAIRRAAADAGSEASPLSPA